MQIDASVLKIDANLIIPNKYQPRKVFDDTALNSLAESIKKYGIINPIIVRKKDDKYEIIAGERRYRAAKLVGITEIPVIIKTADEQQMAELALIENLQRQDLSAIEEAKSYEEIMKIGNQTQASLADKIGKSQSFVANKIRLLSLPEEIQDALANKEISERHARSLLSVEDEEKQLEILDRIIDEKLTVKETEQIINQKSITENEIKQAISDIMKSINIAQVDEEDNIDDKKEEKEDDNMNNGNFFPSFDNNGGNNASLNMMNMQSMNQMPMAPEEEVVMPTPMKEAPIMPTPGFAPEPQLGSSLMQNTNEMNPFASFATNNMMSQPVEPAVSPTPAPSFEMPQMSSPTPGFMPAPEQHAVNPEPSYSPVMDIPLFNPNATIPGFEPVQETPGLNPIVEEPKQIPIMETPAPVESPLPLEKQNKLEDLKNILQANGYNYKVFSNETDNCIIIEIPKN